MTRGVASAVDATPRDSSPLADQDQRDRIRTALDETLVVEAAAGTGKTSELVRRMVANLESGRAELDRMVAVTFTDAAAGELKLRLRAAIEAARLDESRPAASRARLLAALPKLEEARIGTIHSFCADVLRERPVEAGVDPRFEVAADDVARPLFDRVFARWFESQLANPGPGTRRVLRRWKREPMFGPRRRDEGPRGVLRKAAWDLAAHRDFPTPWRQDAGFDRDPRIDGLLEELESLAAWASRGDDDDWLTKSLIEIGKFVDEVRRAERVRPRDHDALEARLVELARPKNKFLTWKGRSRSSNREFPQEELRRKRDDLVARIRTFVEDAGADLAPRLRAELWPVVVAYEEAKERHGCLDFTDLLIRTRDLVRDHSGVRRELQRRFTHYFIDEFQDTDPLQIETFLLLAADDPDLSDWRRVRVTPGKLFVVGDPKQSIYGFRRADLALYREVQRKLTDQGAGLVKLTVSFRSVPEIQSTVNAAFAERLGGAAPDPLGYVPLAPFRGAFPAQPPVVALPVPAPYGDYRTVVDWKIEESLPDVVAAWVDWLVRKSGWSVTERERPGDRVPVEPRHVCLLLRRFKFFGAGDVTRTYVSALEARGLPHLIVGGSSFHEREEIEVLRNALAAIERPDDELAVFATLRGPLLALSDAALLTWRESVGSLYPLRPIPSPPDGLSAALTEVAGALTLLRDLHRGRNSRPVAETIGRLLEATRAHAALAIWPTGSQALANVSRLMDLARRAERQGLISFRAFVDHLEDDADRGDVAEAPLFEEGVEGVRIMTVHRAKGLEFPIVILGDMTAKETFEEPHRWTDASRGLCVMRLAGCAPPELREHAVDQMAREREEAVRLLYVASTRARDCLVVPVIGDERRESWLSTLTPSIYPSQMRARKPLSRTAPGCPDFGEDSLPSRPDNVARPLASVMPGVHEPEAGGTPVVWWDPSVLELGTRPTIGLSQTEILEADTEGRATAALASHEAWKSLREETRSRGQTATRPAAAIAEWARRDETGATAGDAVEIVDARGPVTRPKGVRFGTLVHAVLSTAGLDDDREGIAALAALQSRILGATRDERDAAIEVVATALAHPLLRRAAEAARAGRCRREAPVLIRLEDGTLLDGAADLAFLEDGTWTVLDFKTDAELAPNEAVYRRQVALYAKGIEDSSGMPARGILVRI